MNHKVHFSSQRQNWKTPKIFYEGLNKEFNFNYDPCPPDYKIDGLTSNWGGRSFVNPPYSDILRWVTKGWLESQKGKLVVMLIPSRTDTRWWHDYVMKAKEIRFIKGRLKFDDQKNSAPFPSAIVIFKGDV